MKHFITLVLASASLYAAEQTSNLDKYIPFKVQQEYGLIKLTVEQRNQIAMWLGDKGHTPAPQPPSYITLNISGGSYLQLQDGSVWEIKPSDRINAQGWISSAKIEISPSGDDEYPYKLYNRATRSSVSAKKVTQEAIENL